MRRSAVTIASLEISRFKRLAIRASDVWQGGIVRFPMWIQASDRDPVVRVQGAFWLSTRTGLIWMRPAEPLGEVGVDLAVKALLEFAKKYEREMMGRPARIEVTDAAFADQLRSALNDRDTIIAVVPDLPNVREALKVLETHQSEGRSMPPPLLESPGVTLDGVRGFADAASRFYQANVWNALSPDDDLVAVESPVVDPAMQYLIVTGSTREVRGVTFFPSREEFERFMAAPPKPGQGGSKPLFWMLSFDPIDWMPFGDVDLWTDHELPVAAPDAYPRPGKITSDDSLERPDATRLAYLEAVLGALADSTDEDLDSGRWTRRVETAAGVVNVRLALPRLLDSVDDARPAGSAQRGPVSPLAVRLEMEQAMRKVGDALSASGATNETEARRIVESTMKAPPDVRAARDPKAPPPSALEQAEALAYQAMSAPGRLRTHLARRALAISRDCADAWAVLAGHARDRAAVMPLLREAVAAGERALGPTAFTEQAGHFWGVVETRPYMRARFSLAEELELEEQFDEAITHYRELIRLNPGDNQGVRRPLARLLAELNRDTELRGVIDEFKEDESPEWLYTDALVAFRLAQPDANDRLARALKGNRHVPPFLTGEREIPDVADAYRIGSVEEAALAVDLLLDAWSETPGALRWLNTQRRVEKAAAKSRRRV
jgi:tetratricopeptide (TPR) repeat protein